MPLSDTDQQLVSDLLRQNEGAWATFVDRYAGLMIQVIRHTAQAHSLKLSPDDEDDLCSETFAELLDRKMATIRNFRGRCSLATYLTVVVRRIVLRKLARRRFSEALGHVKVHSASVEVATEHNEASTVDARDEVQSLMKALPPKERDLLKMFYIDGRSYREISRRLGIAVNSVGPLLSRIRKQLTISAGR